MCFHAIYKHKQLFLADIVMSHVVTWSCRNNQKSFFPSLVGQEGALVYLELGYHKIHPFRIQETMCTVQLANTLSQSEIGSSSGKWWLNYQIVHSCCQDFTWTVLVASKFCSTFNIVLYFWLHFFVCLFKIVVGKNSISKCPYINNWGKSWYY